MGKGKCLSSGSQQEQLRALGLLEARDLASGRPLESPYHRKVAKTIVC
jgi:hypothetical protein